VPAPGSADSFARHVGNCPGKGLHAGDGDGENETRLRQYLNKNGDSLVSFTTNGRLWAWSLDTRDDEVGPRNYVIRDSNCDGTFDEVYGLDDEFHVPDCTR
jgi:hypothetical protein